MKKFFTILFLVLTIIFSYTVKAQQVERKMVVLEIGTGTWCTYCPGAAMGAEDLINNGCDVAVIEYHLSDDYSNPEAVSRANYYNITGIPDAYFDGIVNSGGGSHSSSMYSYYLPKYNQRKAIPSDFNLNITGSHMGFTHFNFNIDIEKVGTNSSSNLVLHFAITESDIPEVWQGQTELHFVERAMLPNQYGTNLDFSGSNTQQVNIEFDANPEWVTENCEVVAFIQDKNTKEVMQADKIKLIDVPTTNDYDAYVVKITNVPQNFCDGTVTPSVVIKNTGNETLTTLDVGYTMNSGEVVNYSWTGNLDYLQDTIIDLPTSEFNVQEVNNLEVFTLNPNGQTDQYPANNTADITINESQLNVGGTLYLLLKLDHAPEETTWTIKNSNDDIIFSGGPYATSTTILDTFNFVNIDCYKFTIYDSEGNGINKDDGYGIYRLFDENSYLIAQGGKFEYQEENQFTAGTVGISNNEIKENTFRIFPNPFNDITNIEYTLSENENVNIKVFNILGEVVFAKEQKNESAGKHIVKFSARDLKSGIYFVNINYGNISMTKKLSVTK
ncbi:MAG: T9SS type A sorting domain-containing protein [Bacteroidales bacterium]|nr:T9SS type A sorting domain-containing protein [Bacteroidales bacterium]